MRFIGCLTRPLFYPLLAQLVGVIFWIVLTYETMEVVTGLFPGLNPWILWGIFVLANLPGMYLFFNGFWRYLIWVSGLNLVVRELVEAGECLDMDAYALRITSRSVDYSLILTFLFGIVFVPFGIAMVPIAMAAAYPDWYWICVVASVVIMFVGLLLVCTMLIFLSMVFQVFAFTPGSAGACLFRSMDLVGQNVVKTLAVIAVSVAATQFVLPSVMVALFDLVQLTSLITLGVHEFVKYVLDRSNMDMILVQDEYPFAVMMFNFLAANPVKLSTELARTVVYTFTSAFLLPLGTCWFALLYGELKTRLELKELPMELTEKLTPLS